MLGRSTSYNARWRLGEDAAGGFTRRCLACVVLAAVILGGWSTNRFAGAAQAAQATPRLPVYDLGATDAAPYLKVKLRWTGFDGD
jgi:hypothetical protein